MTDQVNRAIESGVFVIKNILWDLDGTIFDTYPAIAYAIGKSLNELGFSLALNAIDGLARRSIDHCLETLSERFKLDPDLFRAQFAKSYREVPPAKQTPFPGMREVCSWVHEHDGVNVIVTHRAVGSTQTLLDVHDLTSCFDDILSVEQGYARKPDPELITAALEKHSNYSGILRDKSRNVRMVFESSM